VNRIYSFFWAGIGVSLAACAGVRAQEEVPAIPPAVTASSEVAVSTPTVPVVAVEPYQCPLAKCTVLSRFGARTVPGKAVTERHEGICLRASPGQTVRAARSGKVLFAGFSKAYVSRANKQEQQHLIIVRHADGESSRYVHLNTLAVRPPQEVKAGDVLGTASGSDEWTEPVLHFEIRAVNGAALNPEKYLEVKR